MKYKFRAECQHDVTLIKKTLDKITVEWKETKQTLNGYPIPDVEVEFTTRTSVFTLDQIKEKINKLQDCHVVLETIEPIESYTGIRTYKGN